jgi:hypothetical protein
VSVYRLENPLLAAPLGGVFIAALDPAGPFAALRRCSRVLGQATILVALPEWVLAALKIAGNKNRLEIQF